MPTFDEMKKNFLITKVNRGVLLFTGVLTFLYFYIIAFAFPIGDNVLFTFLVLGEIFHVFQVVMYLNTVWDTEYMPPMDSSYMPTVDIFVTVAGEPEEIVAETIQAINEIDYPNFKAYILNDGFVAKKDNWEAIELLAKNMGVGCITRRVPGGAKAGNINNALRETAANGGGGEFVVIFDADHVPHVDFLRKTIPYLADKNVAFVQTPQFYKNYALNYVTQSAWEQQELFFGPICKGKNRLNSATMCGTNMVIRRDMMMAVGGMAEESIAEDFLTGMLLHARGWKSVYVPEVLAEGLAPEDFLSYTKQQFRWARGSLDVIFKHNIFAQRGLTWAQRMQYFSSVTFYLSGVIVAIDALMPIVFFFTGRVPIATSTMTLAAIFLPYILGTLYVLQKSSNYSFTFRALTFSISGFYIHLKAIFTALLGLKSKFSVTPKKQQSGNFIGLVTPHIFYILLVASGMTYAYLREGLSASFVSNSAWALLNIGVFLPFIYASLPSKEERKARRAAKSVSSVKNFSAAPLAE